jgi:hypothetical protein
MLQLNLHASSKTETGLDGGHSKEDSGGRITDGCIINIDVDLNLNVTKCYWRFVGNWCNFIHDIVCTSNDCGTIPYDSIVLFFFYNDTLGGMTKM